MTRARRTLRSSCSSSAGARTALAAVASSAQQTTVVRIKAPFVDRERSGIVYAEPLRAEAPSAYNRPRAAAGAGSCNGWTNTLPGRLLDREPDRDPRALRVLRDLFRLRHLHGVPRLLEGPARHRPEPVPAPVLCGAGRLGDLRGPLRLQARLRGLLPGLPALDPPADLHQVLRGHRHND